MGDLKGPSGRIPCIPRSNLDSSCPNLSKVRREWWREPGFATAISRARSESMPMSRLRQTSTQATITQLFVLSSVIVAAGVAAGRTVDPSTRELHQIQGNWVSQRDEIVEYPSVSGNVVRWSSGRIDSIYKRPIKPQTLMLNGWGLDVSSLEGQSKVGEVVWRQGDNTITWKRDESKRTRLDVKSPKSPISSESAEKLWERGEIAMRVTRHLPRTTQGSLKRGDQEFLVDVGAPPTPRRFRFSRVLPQPPLADQPSRIIKIDVPRPAGIVFERDNKYGTIFVSDIIPNGSADRQRKLSAFSDNSQDTNSIQVGDTLLAFTTTTFEYGTFGLLGAEKPRKSRTLFGIPPNSLRGGIWADVAAAFKSDQLHGEGDISFILERRIEPNLSPTPKNNKD